MSLDRRDLLRTLAGSALVGLPGARGLLEGARRVGEQGGRPGRERVRFDAVGADPTRSRPVRARRPFSMVGLRMPPGTEVAVRVSEDGERFGPWLTAAPLDVEREGPDGAEARRAGNAWKRMSTPVWTGAASWVQLEVEGARPDEVEALLLESPPRVEDAALRTRVSRHHLRSAAYHRDLDEPDVTVPVSSGLRIVTREEWGADEDLRRDGPTYADRVLHGVVHHTAGSNDYSPEDGPRIVRAIYEYHVRDNGWNDIGYNLLIDRYGVVYEGRYGGLDLPVVGAHAAGANTGSFGVGVLGDFRWEELGWPEPRDAVFAVLLWKFGLHALDPDEHVTTAGGQQDVPTLAGHRDVGSTACPGDRVHVHLDDWRRGLRERLAGELTDISGHPHEDAIRSLREAGITTGYADGTFRPDENVTRAQMATFLTRAAKLEPGGEPTFSDVAADHPHARGIAAVAAAGISEGWDDGTFRPARDVTRAQMASFLARALELDPGSGRTFHDVPEHHPHHGSIEAVAAEGIALGRDDGSFRPDEAVTRGHMASFLARAFELPPPGEGPQDGDDLDDDADDEVDDPEDHQVDDADDPDGYDAGSSGGGSA
jgi:hypothetical protein